MNAIQPAAHARAVTGFTDSKAGTGSIVSSAWNRSLLWLLVRFLPVVVLTFAVSAPQAKAALQDGAAATIDGTIHKIMQVDAGYEFYIEDDSLDGKRVYITSSDEKSCQLLSHIHATGTISQPVAGTDHTDWLLTNASFSCQ